MSYHNLYHAVDVMHATYLTLGSMGASGLLTETEQLALILSALCHDLDHPGLTNSFQVCGCRYVRCVIHVRVSAVRVNINIDEISLFLFCTLLLLTTDALFDLLQLTCIIRW